MQSALSCRFPNQETHMAQHCWTCTLRYLLPGSQGQWSHSLLRCLFTNNKSTCWFFSFLHLKSEKSSPSMFCKDAVGIQARKLGKCRQNWVPERRECNQNSKTHAALACCFPAIILSYTSGEKNFKNLLLLNYKVRTGDTKDQAVKRKLIRINLTWKIIKNIFRNTFALGKWRFIKNYWRKINF